MQEIYEIRDPRDSDFNFVMATFLRGLYYGNSWFALIPKNIFMDEYKKVAAYLFSSGRITVKVACLKEDPDVVLGYSAYDKSKKTLIWIFVKKAWREKGIGKKLMDNELTHTMHMTDFGKTLLNKYTLVFNPFYK